MKKSDELKKRMGVNLRTMRKELNLTQAEFAKSLGITGAYVSDLERGLSFPSEPVVRQMQQVYKINREYLFEGRGRPFLQLIRAPTIQLQFFPTKAPRCQQLHYLTEAIPNLKELIEIRGHDQTRQEGVNYLLWWNNGELGYFCTRLSCDTRAEEAEVQQIREACWGAKTPLYAIDGSRQYYPFDKEEGLFDLFHALDDDIDSSYYLEEIDRYCLEKGVSKDPILPPENFKLFVQPEVPVRISSILTMAAAILESQTDHASALATTIRTFHDQLAKVEL